MAGNATDIFLMQVVDFTSFVQVSWLHQVASSLWKLYMMQLDICRLLIRSLDNQLASSLLTRSNVNASWYRHDDCKITSLLQLVYFLLCTVLGWFSLASPYPSSSSSHHTLSCCFIKVCKVSWCKAFTIFSQT